MNIPKSFNEFTVEQFQRWHAVKTEDLLDREIEYLSIAMGKTVDEIEAIPRGELKKYIKVINNYPNLKVNDKVKKFLAIGWKPYQAITDAKYLRELMSADTYMLVQQLSATEADSIQNMHRILGAMYAPYYPFRKPKLEHIKTADKMKQAKIGDVYGAVFFYSVVWQELQPILAQHLEEATKTIMERMGIVRGLSLAKTTGG
jgi:ribonuclease HI